MGRVLVTGATGFLGQHVLSRLADSGSSVVALGRDPRRCALLDEAGYRVVCRNLAGALDTSFDSALSDVETIVHCAALSLPFGRLADFEQANVAATQNLIDFARRKNVRRFVHISSPSVYFAYRDQIDVDEDAALPPPVNNYARTKRQAERIVLGAPELGPVILRPRGIYGAGDRTLLPRLLRVARRRRLPLFRDGAASIDLTHVDDVVAAIVAALSAKRQAEGEIFNISGGEVLPVKRIVEQACVRAGGEVRWRPMPLAPAMFAAGLTETIALLLPGRPEPSVTRYGLGLFAYAQSLNISKAARILGWTPKVGFEEGLDRTFEKGSTP